MKTNNFLKIIFIFWFIFMMIGYAFFDDGGFATKRWIDFIMMPIPSTFFATSFTGITFLFVNPFIWLYSRFLKSKNNNF